MPSRPTHILTPIPPPLRPPRAIDLARKLLCYDPNARLTASQALEHPFLQDVEVLLQGRAQPSTAAQSAQAKAWQASLATCFDEYMHSRNGAMSSLLPSFEQQVGSMLSDGNSQQVHSQVVGAAHSLLKECERLEFNAFGELQRKVLDSIGVGGNGSGNGAGGEASANGASAEQVPAMLAALQQQGGPGEAAKLREQAAEAREEAASLRAELDALNAQLAARGIDAAASDAPPPQEAPNSAAPPSAGRRAMPRLGGDAQGTASPLVARQSMYEEGAEGGAGRGGARGRMQGMGSLAEDELGQLTPLGAASNRGGGEAPPRANAADGAADDS